MGIMRRDDPGLLDETAPASVDQVLGRLLRYEEVLGAVAFSSEGLVVGSSGVSRRDADLVGALGASLVGVSHRTVRRLGAGEMTGLSLGTAEGVIHVHSTEDVALMVFTEACDPRAAAGAFQSAVETVAELLA